MPRRKDHTREQIKAMALAAGMSILRNQGIAEFSIRNVARHIGYTVGTLYNVFEDFDDLVLQLNGQTMDEMLKVMEKESDIYQLTHAYIDFALQHAPEWSLLFEYKGDNKIRPAWYQKKINALFKLVEQALMPLLGCSSEKAALAAKVFGAGLYGICTLSISGKVSSILEEDPENLARSLVENYLLGLISK
ncbi:MAG: TetR/AcrR family transcriptional regulator [Proteobacteria bacterium]|nr:TetR/AcrR family transcriptional regulator [Pseudomonadota bacterium]